MVNYDSIQVYSTRQDRAQTPERTSPSPTGPVAYPSLWYRKITCSAEHPDGLTLEGTVAEQNELFDAIARRFRQYTDR